MHGAVSRTLHLTCNFATAALQALLEQALCYGSWWCHHRLLNFCHAPALLFVCEPARELAGADHESNSSVHVALRDDKSMQWLPRESMQREQDRHRGIAACIRKMNTKHKQFERLQVKCT